MKKIIVKYNVSDNPWIQRYETITFNREKLLPIVESLINSCENKDYKNSYQYDKHVNIILDNIEVANKRPVYMAIIKLLDEKIIAQSKYNWHDGATAVKRCLECKIAYSTPGFIEAKRYNELFN